MASHEFETSNGYDVGRGGVKLPKLEIKYGDFYPHDTVQFLKELWKVNQADGDSIGYEDTKRGTSYFVVPATQYRPTIFAFAETVKGDGQYDSPVTIYQFFTPPNEVGKFQLVMSFTHYSSTNCGYAGGRDRLVVQDHEGQSTSMSLYGNRYRGTYEPDEFTNDRKPGEYNYDDLKSQENLQLLVNKTNELRDILS